MHLHDVLRIDLTVVGAAFSSPALLKNYWNSGGRKTQELKTIPSASHLCNPHGLTRYHCIAEAKLLMTEDRIQKGIEVGQGRKHYAQSITVQKDKQPERSNVSKNHHQGIADKQTWSVVGTTHMSLPNRPASTLKGTGG